MSILGKSLQKFCPQHGINYYGDRCPYCRPDEVKTSGRTADTLDCVNAAAERLRRDRLELAKAAMQGLLANDAACQHLEKTGVNLCVAARGWADEMLAALEEKKE